MRKSGGGAATASGMEFQHRVAAWAAAHILAEKESTPLWGLPKGTILTWLRCETEQPVDDLLLGTSGNGLIFVQVKRNLHLSNNVTSDLASAFDQFVRQFIACRNKRDGNRPWDRPLDPMSDRLVLITAPISSEPIRTNLREVLRRIRSQQSLDDAAVNVRERQVLSVMQHHLKRSWAKTLGTDPSEDEIKDLLALIHVQVLDIDPEGADENHAKNLLRQAVLSTPDEAEVAWPRLITLCSGFAVQRSGANRENFQRELLNAGLSLKSLQSFQDDIRKLREYSTITFKGLSHLSEIRVGSTKVKIKRLCTEALRETAEDGSLLVVGEPGAGKSGALHQFVQSLREDGCDHVFLAVDRLASKSLSQLRDEIGLEHELPDVLENWIGKAPGFLVIDALDAARGDTAQRMIQDLIRMIIRKGERWRVVASIRKFDLRYGVEIRDLFTGVPNRDFQDREFACIRHLNIVRFTNDELKQIASQSAQLYTLITNSPAELRDDLLRVPFNLRLMGDLLGAGVHLSELTPIRTQLELLDRYWSHRVIRIDGQGIAREAVLRQICEKMVGDSILRVHISDVSLPVKSGLLEDLLSTQVLMEWESSPGAIPDRYILAFSHHVLFDYAVSSLLLRDSQERVINRLVNTPDLVVLIRPSLMLHFRHLWTTDGTKQQFWDFIINIIRATQIPEIGKIIGPSVAAEETKKIQDLEPLCFIIENPDSEIQASAEQALRHLVGALLTASVKESFVGTEAGPWCQLIEKLSRDLRLSVAYIIQLLLSKICESPEDLNFEQRTYAGKAARRILELAWAQPSRNNWFVINALAGVCRTFESDPIESAGLIRRCLAPLNLSEHGFEELPWLAREVKRLIGLDPPLVTEIYKIAFGYQERSDKPVPMGSSRILTMISNRKQDYGMALYELAEVFPHFLESTPLNAINALIYVIEAYIAQRHSTISYEKEEKTFDFDGRQGRIRVDYSSIWDNDEIHGHDKPFKMLQSFQKYLENLAKLPGAVNFLHRIVEVLISENRSAVIWSRVLSVAAQNPSTLGREILPLLWAIPILTSYDTSHAAGKAISAIFPELEASERERIELSILSIPRVSPKTHRESAEHIRNRLLGCLPPDKIITVAAQNLLSELKEKNTIPSNKRPVHFSSGSRPYGEEEFLRDEGVPVEDEKNRMIREIESPVKEFAKKNLNSTPTLEEVSGIFPSLQALHQALARSDIETVHPKQLDYAWGTLADACACIARIEDLSSNDALGALVEAVLLEASHHEKPIHDPEQDAQFDDFPSWGGPSARIEAAQGLIVLARNPSFSNPEIFASIDRLSKDPVPAVRFQIARSLNTISRTAPELMWRLIELMSHGDSSRGVLQAILSGPFHRLGGSNPDRIADLTNIIFERITEGPGAKTVREFCVGIFADLYIWRGNAQCQVIIFGLVADPFALSDDISHVLPHLREPLTNGPIHPSDPVQNAVRTRAIDLLDRILKSARNAISEVESRFLHVSFDSWPVQDQEITKSVFRIIDTIGSEVYFASGAYDEREHTRAEGVKQGFPEEAGRFYIEVSSILDDLAEVSLPSVTHHLVQTLEYFIPFDPSGVFLRIGRVIHSGQRAGYQYELLAADLIIKLVERYLAEYRTLLREDAQARQTLIDILDIFVGWPSARKLTYRLEDIFR